MHQKLNYTISEQKSHLQSSIQGIIYELTKNQKTNIGNTKSLIVVKEKDADHKSISTLDGAPVQCAKWH